MHAGSCACRGVRRTRSRLLSPRSSGAGEISPRGVPEDGEQVVQAWLERCRQLVESCAAVEGWYGLRNVGFEQRVAVIAEVD
jgi:hypothetical protein